MGSKRGFKLTSILWIVVVSAGLGGVVPTYGLSNDEGEKLMDTGCLGGVAHPTGEQLAAMHKLQKVPFLQDYILHARGGKLTKVAVEKTLLPHDPAASHQFVSVAKAPDGTVYVMQPTIICKSTDEGRTWTSYERSLGPAGQSMGGNFHILSDGTFIAGTGGTRSDSIPEWAFLDVVVCVSADEGRSWRKISEIKLPEEYHDRYIYPNYQLFRLPDNTLLCGVATRKTGADNMALMYRSFSVS